MPWRAAEWTLQQPHERDCADRNSAAPLSFVETVCQRQIVDDKRPEALRPCLATGLPLSISVAVDNNKRVREKGPVCHKFANATFVRSWRHFVANRAVSAKAFPGAVSRRIEADVCRAKEKSTAIPSQFADCFFDGCGGGFAQNDGRRGTVFTASAPGLPGAAVGEGANRRKRLI